jgi:MFS family permease
VVTPSIYQFITTPASLPEELENEEDTGRFWPGLGGSDWEYTWTLTVPPIVEFSVAPFALWMAHRCPFTVTLLIGLLFLAVSGALYALAVNVWMVIVARGLMGASGGLSIPALHTYVGEMGSVMDDVREKQGVKPRKFSVYIAFSFIMNGGFVVAFAFTSVIAQFPTVNPYHWPGWFIAALAAAEAVGIICFFQETRPFTYPKIPRFNFSGLKLSLQLSSRWSRHFAVSFTNYTSF